MYLFTCLSFFLACHVTCLYCTDEYAADDNSNCQHTVSFDVNNRCYANSFLFSFKSCKPIYFCYFPICAWLEVMLQIIICIRYCFVLLSATHQSRTNWSSTFSRSGIRRRGWYEACKSQCKPLNLSVIWTLKKYLECSSNTSTVRSLIGINSTQAV